MPFYNEDLPAQSRQEFCLALKATRERKGISLSQISDATKIPASLFAALERNDLRRWPQGLFRRSFFRDYARAIGVPVSEACEEFVRLFPDASSIKTTEAASESTGAEQGAGVRLAFDVTWHGHREPFRSRIKTASLDGMIVVGLALLLMRLSDLTWSSSTAIVALAYFCLSTMIFGESAAKWALRKLEAIAGAPGDIRSRIGAVWSGVSGVLSSVFGKSDDASTEPVDDPEPRPWITDARRVGVRVKLLQ